MAEPLLSLAWSVLRIALERRELREGVRFSWIYLLTIGSWADFLAMGAGLTLSKLQVILLIAVLVAPFSAALARKRDILVAGYTVLLWQVIAAALVQGFFFNASGPQSPDCRIRIASSDYARLPVTRGMRFKEGS